MNAFLKSRLSIMFFLQYAAIGVYYPYLAIYLKSPIQAGGMGFSAFQIGLILGLASSVGAFLSPFVGGQVADRYLSAEKLLALLLIASGGIRWVVSDQTSFPVWFGLWMLHSILTFPTITLTRSLALAHLEDGEREFPRVRVWGTVSWILAGWIFPLAWLMTDVQIQSSFPFVSGADVVNSTARLADGLKISAVLTIAFGMYALCLPSTPPSRDAKEKFAFIQTLREFKRRSLLILVVAVLGVDIALRVTGMQIGPYIEHLGVKKGSIGPLLTIEQIVEMIAMPLLGIFLIRFRFRKVMLAGLFGYILFFAMLSASFVPLWVTMSSLALPGICFPFFGMAAYLYIDRVADDSVKNSIQTFLLIVTGAGQLIAGLLNGALEGVFSGDASVTYAGVWISLAAISAVSFITFFLFFHEELPEGNAKRPMQPVDDESKI